MYIFKISQEENPFSPLLSSVSLVSKKGSITLLDICRYDSFDFVINQLFFSTSFYVMESEGRIV